MLHGACRCKAVQYQRDGDVGKKAQGFLFGACNSVCEYLIGLFCCCEWRKCVDPALKPVLEVMPSCVV